MKSCEKISILLGQKMIKVKQETSEVMIKSVYKMDSNVVGIKIQPSLPELFRILITFLFLFFFC